ncbi:hypothetical protein A6E27_22810 [Bacillus cereus]|nr:hypothetical protein A6E27_22810 [Bacillus cereus]
MGVKFIKELMSTSQAREYYENIQRRNGKMIKCQHCGSPIGRLQESPELHVIGEIAISVICHKCKEWTTEKLYEYDKNRITYKATDKGNVTEIWKVRG